MFSFLRREKASPDPQPDRLDSSDALEAALDASEEAPILLFKHSETCGVSLFARREVLRLTDEADPKVFEIVVQRARAVSNEIAARFNIRHASPQAILVSNRKPVWDASHGAITDSAVRAAVKAVTTLVVMVVLAACAQPNTGSQSASGEAGDLANEEAPLVVEEQKMAPDFSLAELSGGTYTLSESRGKVVILNFWATWCGPCVRETPGFVDLQNEWADQPFEIVGISVDEGGFDTIRAFVEDYQVPYPMVMDDGALADEIGGVYAMPSSFIVDKNGAIAHRVVGEFPFEQLRPEIERLMAE